MQITKELVDNLNAVIKIELQPQDYQGRVDEVIKKYQKTAQIPGFRSGKVPSGVIRKMYGKTILAEELNKLLSDSLGKYIYENQLEILGSPLPKTESNDQQVFEEGKSFQFFYECGLAPAFDVELSEKDKLDFFKVVVEDKMVEDELTDLRRRYGKFSNPETSDETNILYGEFVELDESGEPKTEGNKTTTTLVIEMIKSDTYRKKFMGLKIGDTVDFNPLGAIGHKPEVAAMLKLEKGDDRINSNYRFTVKTINQIDKAELNQDFFDKLFGKDVVKSEEELRQKIKENIENHFEKDSNRKLKKDLKNYLLEKLDIPLPDDFLKRMLQATQQENIPSGHEFEHQYYHLAEDLRWDLVKNKLAKSYAIEVNGDELLEAAKQLARQQFAQYGYYDMNDQKLTEMANRFLSENGGAEKLERSLLEEKVFVQARQKVKLKTRELPYADFVEKLSEKTAHETEHHH